MFRLCFFPRVKILPLGIVHYVYGICNIHHPLCVNVNASACGSCVCCHVITMIVCTCLPTMMRIKVEMAIGML